MKSNSKVRQLLDGDEMKNKYICSTVSLPHISRKNHHIVKVSFRPAHTTDLFTLGLFIATKCPSRATVVLSRKKGCATWNKKLQCQPQTPSKIHTLPLIDTICALCLCFRHQKWTKPDAVSLQCSRQHHLGSFHFCSFYSNLSLTLKTYQTAFTENILNHKKSVNLKR